MNIQLHQLIEAYRKAKVDAFYENGHVTVEQFALYEKNLISNLKELQAVLNNWEVKTIFLENYVGVHTLALKKINLNQPEDPQSKIYNTNTEKRWKSLNQKNIESIEFRLIGVHHVNFHILSSLWIQEVGYLLDAALSDSAYGCRLIRGNRVSSETEISETKKGRFGHFIPYINSYQQWQEDGINAIQQAIFADKKIIAVTADITKFYHRIDADFIFHKEFKSFFEIEALSDDQKELTELLIEAIKHWSLSAFNDPKVPEDFKAIKSCGIPIGLSASKIIANLVLIGFDKKILSELSPVYYGRYVDDIFIVLEDHGAINSSNDLWKYITKRIESVSKSNQIKGNKTAINFSIPYSPDSLIEFGKEKEKIFYFENFCGTAFLDSIRKSLSENSSEWNLPPNLEHDLEDLVAEVAKTNNDFTESANGLRKADGLSIQRLKFVLYLRRIEILIELLPKKSWEPKIKNLFELVKHHAITPDNFAIYLKYFPRVLQIATKIGHYQDALNLLHRIDNVYAHLQRVSPNIKPQLDLAKKLTFDLIDQAICQGIHPNANLENDVDFTSEIASICQQDPSAYSNRAKELFIHDFHSIPFKNAIIESEINLEDFPINTFDDILDEISSTDYLYLDGFESLCEVLRNNKHLPQGALIASEFNIALYFHTRAFRLSELGLVFPDWHQNIEGTYKKIFTLFRIETEVPIKPKPYENDLTLLQLGNKLPLNRKFAFTSLETLDNSWTALVIGKQHEPDKTRIQRILSLCNDILAKKECEIQYVVFPEVSIPRKLLIYLSTIFLKRGISLIIGAEYRIKGPNELETTKYVSNQLIYFLTVNGKWRNHHATIIQEKVIPAIHEERELFNVGGAILRATDESKYIINHGGFWMAGLICNEFMDIGSRAKYRGYIDALITVEWNKDTDMYNALVESSSNDLHTFIIQVNNRRYGDTRLRAPFKESYERDVVRVRGGELDYFVVATLRVEELRDFQRHHRSPSKPFKPVPTGFKMSNERRKNQ